jgi:hypothetical protein
MRQEINASPCFLVKNPRFSGWAGWPSCSIRTCLVAGTQGADEAAAPINGVVEAAGTPA